MKTEEAVVKKLTDSNFEAVINEYADRVSVVDFWAPWCGPCKMMAPILDDFATDHVDTVTVAKVNVDEAADLAARYEIRSIPTLVFFKNGKEVDRVTGVMNNADLEAKLAGL